MLYVNPMVGQQALQRAVPESPERRKEALQEFEHLLAFQLLREMRKTIPKNDLFGRSFASGYYDELMDDYLAGQLAKSGQLGVARMLEMQLDQTGRAAQRDVMGRLKSAAVSSIPTPMPIITPAADAGTARQTEIR
jgi:Rod binding domain-containing protein